MKFNEMICPNCGKKIKYLRDKKGRIILVTGLGIGLAIVGGTIGAGIGIATGGSGIAATVPFSIIGLAIGSGGGYLIGDKIIDKPKCPECGTKLSF